MVNNNDVDESEQKEHHNGQEGSHDDSTEKQDVQTGVDFHDGDSKKKEKKDSPSLDSKQQDDTIDNEVEVVEPKSKKKGKKKHAKNCH